MVQEKTLENPLTSKEIKPVNPKGNQPWIFTGRTDGEAEALLLWPPDVKSWLIGKDPDAGKDWRQEEKGMTEDEMVGWHHGLNGYEFEQDSEGQGSLVLYCMGLQRVEHDWATEQQNPMIQQSHSWIYVRRKWNQNLDEISILSHSLQSYLQQPRYGRNPRVHWWMDKDDVVYIQRNITQQWEWKKSCHLLQSG